MLGPSPIQICMVKVSSNSICHLPMAMWASRDPTPIRSGPIIDREAIQINNSNN